MHAKQFFVVKTEGPAIFGLPMTQHLGLLTVHVDATKTTRTATSTDMSSAENGLTKSKILAEYPACINGIGKLPGTYHISLDADVQPVVYSPRHVPVALRDDIKTELQSMEKDGIITN